MSEVVGITDVEHKRRIVTDLCDSVRDIVLTRVPQMPEGWDGLELRQYIAELFERQTFDMGRGRLRQYREDLVRRGL